METTQRRKGLFWLKVQGFVQRIMAAGTWGSWSLCIHSWKAERGGCIAQLTLSFAWVQDPSPRDAAMHIYLNKHNLDNAP